MKGLEILTYLRASGIKIDDDLCEGVPDSVIQELGISKVVYIVNTLVDDTLGEKANRFPDYYNRVPNETTQAQIPELREAFKRFVQQILFKEKTETTVSHNPHQFHQLDALGEQIESLIGAIRVEWLTWSIGEGYREILSQMEVLLPLLQKKYQDPMLESNAMMTKELVKNSIIPDEYITFLYDITITLVRIFNVKLEQIQESPNLWRENADLMNSLHTIAKGLCHDLDWDVFNITFGENQPSIKNLTTGVIQGVNSLYFWLQENEKATLRHDIPETPMHRNEVSKKHAPKRKRRKRNKR